jgi:hypothetical protein
LYRAATGFFFVVQLLATHELTKKLKKISQELAWSQDKPCAALHRREDIIS